MKAFFEKSRLLLRQQNFARSFWKFEIKFNWFKSSCDVSEPWLFPSDSECKYNYKWRNVNCLCILVMQKSGPRILRHKWILKCPCFCYTKYLDIFVQQRLLSLEGLFVPYKKVTTRPDKLVSSLLRWHDLQNISLVSYTVLLLKYITS
jgi:hypothetical protein